LYYTFHIAYILMEKLSFSLQNVIDYNFAK